MTDRPLTSSDDPNIPSDAAHMAATNNRVYLPESSKLVTLSHVTRRWWRQVPGWRFLEALIAICAAITSHFTSTPRSKWTKKTPNLKAHERPKMKFVYIKWLRREVQIFLGFLGFLIYMYKIITTIKVCGKNRNAFTPSRGTPQSDFNWQFKS